jgi:hypothetical protein
MPKFDVTFTVSPMQVEICIDQPIIITPDLTEDVDQQHSVAIEKAEGVLQNWLRFGITQWLGFTSHSIKVTYMDYEVYEVKEQEKEAVDGDNQ